MSFLRCLLVLQFATTFAAGQSAPPSKPPAYPTGPKALIRILYTGVVASPRHNQQEMRAFAPYLSEALLHRIDLAKACSDDWDRQNPDSHLKAEMASQYGLFSGDGAEARPISFKIGQIEARNDGSSLIYVRLTGSGTIERRWSWRVAAEVIRESGRYVIGDVIYINDATYDNLEDKPADRRLSEYLAAGCDGPRWIGYALPKQPEALVRSLYKQVVSRGPGGIPSGADWKTFAPYMGKTLLHRIDDFNSCVADWSRPPQDPRFPLKPPFGVFESGIFSGGDERTGPRTFQIYGTQPEKDGSVRLQVRLTWWDAPVHKKVDDWHEYTSAEKPLIWQVAPILVQENGRYVVDDVIYLKDETQSGEVDWRLSQSLAEGCDGPRWIGYRGKGNKYRTPATMKPYPLGDRE